jgi:hypothetical protein
MRHIIGPALTATPPFRGNGHIPAAADHYSISRKTVILKRVAARDRPRPGHAKHSPGVAWRQLLHVSFRYIAIERARMTI